MRLTLQWYPAVILLWLLLLIVHSYCCLCLQVVLILKLFYLLLLYIDCLLSLLSFLLEKKHLLIEIICLSLHVASIALMSKGIVQVLAHQTYPIPSSHSLCGASRGKIRVENRCKFMIHLVQMLINVISSFLKVCSLLLLVDVMFSAFLLFSLWRIIFFEFFVFFWDRSVVFCWVDYLC